MDPVLKYAMDKFADQLELARQNSADRQGQHDGVVSRAAALDARHTVLQPVPAVLDRADAVSPPTWLTRARAARSRRS